MKLSPGVPSAPHRVTGGDDGYRANVFAAWMVGAGGGLVATMVSWLLGSRLVAAVLDAPVGPVVALLGAIAVGSLVAVRLGGKLRRAAIAEAHRRIAARPAAGEDGGGRA